MIGESDKGIRKVLKILGPEYTTKTIDGDLCVYRDLKNGRDIEISVRENGKCGYITTWNMKGGIYALETVWKVRDHEHMKRILDYMVGKYGGERSEP